MVAAGDAGVRCIRRWLVAASTLAAAPPWEIAAEAGERAVGLALKPGP